MSEEKLKVKLSASRLKTAKACSWEYFVNYILSLPRTSNSGANRGTICHLIFECLGNPRHKHIYDKIIEERDIFASPGIKRLVQKHAKVLDVDDDENIQLIKDMTLNGLEFDFFGKDNGRPTQAISEYDFDISVDEDGKKYRIKGFIDKLFLYKTKKQAIIRDFKTSKKIFEGEEVDNNLQDYMYSLAVKHIFPEYKKRRSEFLFLKFDLSSKGSLKMESIDEKKLDEFERQLTEAQEYLEQFDLDDAISGYAGDKPTPKDGSFGGQLKCGFAKYPGEPKKDGNPKWHCPYKFGFSYFALIDEDGGLLSTAFAEDYYKLTKAKKKGQKIKRFYYKGCPRWTNYTQEDFDDLR